MHHFTHRNDIKTQIVLIFGQAVVISPRRGSARAFQIYGAMV